MQARRIRKGEYKRVRQSLNDRREAMNGPWGDGYEGVKRTWLENVSLSKLATTFFCYDRDQGCNELRKVK